MKKTVTPDLNLSCPSCGEPLDNELLDFALADADNDVLIFLEDGSINKANLLHLAKGHKPIGDTALVLPVNKDFFNLIEPDLHDRTKADSPYGKVILSKKSKETQAILNMLKSHAKEYGELKNKTSVLNSSLSFAEEFKEYENLWESKL